MVSQPSLFCCIAQTLEPWSPGPGSSQICFYQKGKHQICSKKSWTYLTLFWHFCLFCATKNGMSWLSFLYCPVITVLTQLPSHWYTITEVLFNSRVTAMLVVLPRPSYQGCCLVIVLSWISFESILSRRSYLGHPVGAILSWISGQGCPAVGVLLWLSCHGYQAITFLSYHGCFLRNGFSCPTIAARFPQQIVLLEPVYLVVAALA